MKHFKLIVLMCLVVLMAITAVACGGTETPATTAATTTSGVETTPTATAETTPAETTPAETTPAETTPVATTPATTAPETTEAIPTAFEALKIGDTPISDYTIVYAKSPYDSYTRIPNMKQYFPVYDFDHETANRLSDLIFEVTGVRLKVAQDTKTTETENEILVGKTNRKLTGGIDLSTLTNDDYVVNTVGTKFVICGGAHGTTWHAIDYLETLFADKLANKEVNYSFANNFVYTAQYHLVVIGCIGDSITYGSRSSDPVLFSYPAQMSRILWKDAIVYNYGDSGSTMRNDHVDAYTKTSLYNSAVNNAPNVDIFTIMLGTNDSDRFRNWGDSDTEKYIKDYFSLLETLQQKNANVKFVLANCPAYFGGGYFGSAKMRQIQESLFPVVIEKGYSATFYDTYSATKTMSAYFPDQLHPNDMGYLKMAEAFAEYLQTLFSQTAEK